MIVAFNERVTNVRTSNIIVLVFAVVMGGIAAFMARAWLQGQSQGSTQSTGTIVIATAPLDAGVEIPEDKIAAVPWGLSTFPEGSFATKQDFLKDGKRTTLAPIGRNEPLLRSKVTAPGESLLTSLMDKDKRAVTVRVDDVRGVAGFIRPGNRVDVVMITSINGRSHSGIILQNVKVLAVDQVAAQQVEKGAVVAKAVTLEVTPDEANKVTLATSVGRLSLILRRSGETTMEVGRIITERDLMQLAAPVREATPNEAASPMPVQRETTTVTIIRGSKSEDYSVKDAAMR